MEQVDLRILTGFLGSGKTTMLAKWLQAVHQRNRRVVVIMNEMGELDIDGELLQGAGFPVKKLLNGCVCCSIQGELAAGVQELISLYAPEEIILETTGVADPADIVDDLQRNPVLARLVRIRQIITVVDTSRFLALHDRFATSSALEMTIRHQLSAADVLLLNKLDLATDADVPDKVEHLIRAVNHDAPLYRTVRSELDFAQLDAIPPSRTSVHLSGNSAGKTAQPRVQKTLTRYSPAPDAQAGGSYYDAVETFAYPFSGPVSRDKLEAVLLHLPETVLRAKGFVQFAHEDIIHSFQQTETQLEFAPFAGEVPHLAAVFIGIDLDKRSLVEALAACAIE